MIIHSIVLAFLTILSTTAAYAASVPVNKAPGEQQPAEPCEEETDTSRG